MRKFLIHVAIIFCLFFAVDKLAYFILKKEASTQQDTRLQHLLNGDYEKEILVLGSSRAASAVDAGLLEKKTGLSTLNLAYRGSNIEFQEDLLRLYLASNQAPEKLLLIIDNPYIFQEEPSLSYRYDVLYPFAYDDRINSILIEKNKHSVASKIIYLLRVHSNHLNLNFYKKPMNFPVDSFGFQPLPVKTNDSLKMVFGQQIAYQPKNDLKTSIRAFENIKDLTTHYGIELHLVFPPDFRSFNEPFFNQFKKNYGMKGHVYRYDSNNQQYMNADYYYDSPHLNKKGATVFTKELATYLNN